ncbi:MAG: exonuclease SbcCD subunit D C-terminal domain-containing protein [Tannerellaceae bacterium]|nr:exonuclease SbcCD subunit D C-terminal domain-containing protein [Tannerellaceae bacterium]
MQMKIIHTADWHLGQTFFGYDRDEEHQAFLEWLTALLVEQQTDALLISGDIFDVANPSATSQRRLFHFLKEVNRRNPSLQVVITAGNHDSAARLEAPDPLLKELSISVIGVIKRLPEGGLDLTSLVVPLSGKDGKRKAWCMAVPFLRQGDYPPAEEPPHSYVQGIYRMYHALYRQVETMRQPGEAVIAMGHLHATGAELTENDRSERVIMGGLESVPADAFPAGLAYTALGHIHKAQRVGGKENVRYAGSPLPMSFSETKYRHQVVSIQIKAEEAVSIEAIPVPRTVDLLRIPANPADPAEVEAQLRELPELADEPLWKLPYLEIQVLLTEPDPGFRHRVEEILSTKAVRLTSIVPSYPKQEKDSLLQPLSYTDLQKIDPLVMLEHTYSAKYGSELPEEIKELFHEVMQEVAL